MKILNNILKVYELTIFTTMTDLKKDDPREALKCYEDFADEVVVVGDDWPDEFSFDFIEKNFKKDLINQQVIG